MIIDDLIPLAAKIEELKPWGKNPRKGNVDAVMRSLAKFGQRKPIVANRSTREVIAGNHTFEAAKRLGWKQIAVVWVDDDEKTATAFALADNRTQDLGYYDEEALEELIASLDEQDLLIASGYADDMDIPENEMLRQSTIAIPSDPNAITTQYTDSVDGLVREGEDILTFKDAAKADGRQGINLPLLVGIGHPLRLGEGGDLGGILGREDGEEVGEIFTIPRDVVSGAKSHGS